MRAQSPAFQLSRRRRPHVQAMKAGGKVLSRGEVATLFLSGKLMGSAVWVAPVDAVRATLPGQHVQAIFFAAIQDVDRGHAGIGRVCALAACHGFTLAGLHGEQDRVAVVGEFGRDAVELHVRAASVAIAADQAGIASNMRSSWTTMPTVLPSYLNGFWSSCPVETHAVIPLRREKSSKRLRASASFANCAECCCRLRTMADAEFE